MEVTDFANRFLKVYKHIRKWASREQVTCYRIYDWDIPNYPLVIDRYEDYLHVAEYKSRHHMSDAEHREWLDACMQSIAQITEIATDYIVIKERRRIDRSIDQYEKLQSDHIITVQEDGLQFKVNLTQYLDTGLFLDHRPLRSMVRALSAGKRVLNLFSYTGSFSVYAAAGGASEVTTVDLSNTYIHWARDNFLLNHLDIDQHRFVVSDVMKFLEADTATYDIVIADPPSFSNSKKVQGTWDTQRDHRKLLLAIRKRMLDGGICFFSNNLRTFHPEFTRLPYSHIQEISHRTVPLDFRNKKIHRSFQLDV